MNATKLTEIVVELATKVVRHEREIDELKGALERVLNSLADAHRDNAVLRSRLDDHLKRVDTWAARAWTLVTVLVGAVLSLAGGLIAALARK